MIDDLEPLFDEDEESVYDRVETDLNRDYEPTDEAHIDSRVGSMFQIISQPLIQEHARLWDAISVDVPNAIFPTRSWGDYLDEWAEVFGIFRTDATNAQGKVTFEGTAGTIVPGQTVVSAVQTDPAVEAPEYTTLGDGAVIPEEIDPPDSLTATPTEGGNLAETTFYYVVTALNPAGETTASTEASATTTSTDQTVTLSWAAVDGATGYRVWRSNATGDSNKRFLAAVVSPAYIDAGQDSTTTETLPAENTTTGRVTIDVEAIEPGVLGNIGAEAITLLVTPIDGIDSVTNANPIEGGAEEEDDEQLRTRVLLSFRGSGAGTQADYIRWCLSYPGVGRATVVPLIDGPGTVGCIVMTATGDPVSEAIVDGLQYQLDPLPGQGAGLASIDHTVTVSTPTQVIIDVDATLVLDEGFGIDEGVALRSQIVSAIKSYIDQLDAGEDVIYGHVLAKIHAVEGVYKVTNCTVNGGTEDIEIDVGPPEVASLGTVTLTED